MGVKTGFAGVQPPQAPVLAEGIVVREVGEFVGRRHEIREARRVLAGRKAGLVVHGIGGAGKSTLAAEILRTLTGDTALAVSAAGPVSVDDILSEVGARIRHAATAAGIEGLARAGLMLRAADVEWAERWRLLVEQTARPAHDRAAGQLRRQPGSSESRRRVAGPRPGTRRLPRRVGPAPRPEPAPGHLPPPLHPP